MAWEIIALGTKTDAGGGNLVLDEPANTAAGDLIVACIAWKGTEPFTLPADWAYVASQLHDGDNDATGGIASGLMAYIVRGVSAPSYTFTRTLGDVARGQTVTYRGNSAAPYDTGSVNQAGSVTEPIGTTITTAEAGELLVGMVAHGDNSTTSIFDAVTAPSIASNGTIDVNTEPTLDTWQERSDGGTNTGSDTGLFIVDAVKGSAGATGAFSALAQTDSNSVTIVGAFKFLSYKATDLSFFGAV